MPSGEVALSPNWPTNGIAPLVAAEVEGADGDALAAGALDRPRSATILLLLVGRHRPVHEHELGAQQADPGGAGVDDVLHLHRQLDVRLQTDRHAVAGHRRLAGELAQRALLLLPFAAATSVFLHRHRRRMDDDLAMVAVDQDGIAGAHRLQQAGGAEHRRQTQGAGEDRGMPLGTAHLGGDADDVLGIELRRLRRRQLLGDDDAAVRN